MSIFAATSTATEEFAKVKSSMESSDPTLPIDPILWFGLAVVVIVVISLIISWMRRKQHALMFRGWTSINETDRVTTIFKRAAVRQAGCTLEIFSHQHTNIYRGHIYEAVAGSHMVVELAKLPGQEANFEGLPVQVHLNFRPAPKESMEHYQFSSQTSNLTYQKERNWRVARLTIAWPKSVISAQRRDFLRVEPGGSHSLHVALRAESPLEINLADIDHLPKLVDGTVLDISVGGTQLIFQGIPNLPEAEAYLISFDLPLEGLDFEMKEHRLHLVITPLTKDVFGFSVDETRQAAEKPRLVMRCGFRGRYRFDHDTKTWKYYPFSQEHFQDLAHWINAYQRYQLKKDKGLISVQPDRINVYPSIPPERPAPKDD